MSRRNSQKAEGPAAHQHTRASRTQRLRLVRAHSGATVHTGCRPSQLWNVNCAITFHEPLSWRLVRWRRRLAVRSHCSLRRAGRNSLISGNILATRLDAAPHAWSRQSNWHSTYNWWHGNTTNTRKLKPFVYIVLKMPNFNPKNTSENPLNYILVDRTWH